MTTKKLVAILALCGVTAAVAFAAIRLERTLAGLGTAAGALARRSPSEPAAPVRVANVIAPHVASEQDVPRAPPTPAAPVRAARFIESRSAPEPDVLRDPRAEMLRQRSEGTETVDAADPSDDYAVAEDRADESDDSAADLADEDSDDSSDLAGQGLDNPGDFRDDDYDADADDVNANANAFSEDDYDDAEDPDDAENEVLRAALARTTDPAELANDPDPRVRQLYRKFFENPESDPGRARQFGVRPAFNPADR